MSELLNGRKLIEVRDTQMAPNVSVFYKDRGGLIALRGDGCYMVDEKGQRHLDTCNNVACVGHSHPTVVRAGQEALGQIQTNQRFLHPTQQRYISKLLDTFPPELDTVYLCNSGSEANDLALRMGREHAKKTAKNPNDVIVLDWGYHGNTTATMELSPYKWCQKPTLNTTIHNSELKVDNDKETKCEGYIQPSHVHVVNMPDVYRGKYSRANGYSDLEAAEMYAAEVGAIVVEDESNNARTCSNHSDPLRRSPDGRAKLGIGGCGVFIAESAMGCGGQIILPPTYLAKCYDYVRSGGGVCIADEVQTGFGRCGEHFWMFQLHDVVPDIVTLGKPMGNGYPLSAVVCRRSIANSFAATGIEYFNTFGGNSVACAIGEAVLDTIRDENLQENALLIGRYLGQELEALRDAYACIGDVRGCGLFQGVEFVVCDKRRSSDATVAEPDDDTTQKVVDYLQTVNIISSRDGNVLKIKPPLVFGQSEVDLLIDGLKQAMEHLGKWRKSF